MFFNSIYVFICIKIIEILLSVRNNLDCTVIERMFNYKYFSTE